MKRGFDRWEIIFVAAVVVAGAALRLRLALLTYLNPDEALQVLLALGTWSSAFRNSLTVTHPPLLIMMIHGVSLISRTELAVRLVPILAGSLFPLLIFAWLRRVAGRMAAMGALLVLTLAPHLISVSAQLRSYTLALLFLAAALWALEEALESGRWPMMAVYNVLLWLCIVSDYSTAWFVGAAGIYALLRLRGASAEARVTWAAGQVGALALYGLLFELQVRHLSRGSIEEGAVLGWLWGAFPHPGGRLSFPLVNTFKQFSYLMASTPLGGLALVLFAIAVWGLWTGRTRIERSKARALALLLVLPFPLAIAGAYALLFPYGRTRHTLVIGVAVAIGMATLLEWLPRRAAIAILWGALLLTPLWHWKADWDQQDIAPDRNRKEQMAECLNYMRAAIPPDTAIFTARDTLLILAYYEGGKEAPPEPSDGKFSETLLGGRWRVLTRDSKFENVEVYRKGLSAFRRNYGLGETDPVWVLDGGWNPLSRPWDETRPFTMAIRIFQDGDRTLAKIPIDIRTPW